MGGATSQLDLSSLTTLSVAGCGGTTTIGVLHLAISVIIARFSTGRLLASKDFTFKGE